MNFDLNCPFCPYLAANLEGAAQAAQDARRSRDAMEFLLQLLLYAKRQRPKANGQYKNPAASARFRKPNQRDLSPSVVARRRYPAGN